MTTSSSVTFLLAFVSWFDVDYIVIVTLLVYLYYLNILVSLAFNTAIIESKKYYQIIS